MDVPARRIIAKIYAKVIYGSMVAEHVRVPRLAARPDRIPVAPSRGRATPKFMVVDDLLILQGTRIVRTLVKTVGSGSAIAGTACVTTPACPYFRS